MEADIKVSLLSVPFLLLFWKDADQRNNTTRPEKILPTREGLSMICVGQRPKSLTDSPSSD